MDTGIRLSAADMVKMILRQSMHQAAVTPVLHFLGHGILGVDHSEHGDEVVTIFKYTSRVSRETLAGACWLLRAYRTGAS